LAAKLEGLCVLPGRIGRGVGTALLEAACAAIEASSRPAGREAAVVSWARP
jgi:GNAT superfamily N-acetyltransferase